MSRFSRTVMRGKHLRPSGDCEIPSWTMSCGAVRVISLPSKLTCPWRAGVRPEIERSVVDLPAPLEPMSVTHSPSSTASVTPFRASMFP